MYGKTYLSSNWESAGPKNADPFWLGWQRGRNLWYFICQPHNSRIFVTGKKKDHQEFQFLSFFLFFFPTVLGPHAAPNHKTTRVDSWEPSTQQSTVRGHWSTCINRSVCWSVKPEGVFNSNKYIHNVVTTFETEHIYQKFSWKKKTSYHGTLA